MRVIPIGGFCHRSRGAEMTRVQAPFAQHDIFPSLNSTLTAPIISSVQNRRSIPLRTFSFHFAAFLSRDASSQESPQLLSDNLSPRRADGPQQKGLRLWIRILILFSLTSAIGSFLRLSHLFMFVIVMKSIPATMRTDGSRSGAKRSVQEIGGRQRHRLKWRSGLSGQSDDAGHTVQDLAALRRSPVIPWMQIPAGQIGVVIAQVGAAPRLPGGRQVGRLQSRVRKFSRPRDLCEWRRTERRAAFGAAAR